MYSWSNRIHPTNLVLTLSIIITVYYSIYAFWKTYPTNWNNRKSELDYEELQTDTVFAQIQDFYKNSSFPPDLTIVTAYFNIGSFGKGEGSKRVYTPHMYEEWMSVFGRIDNPLIVFTDSQNVVDLFTKLRAKFPPERTRLFLMKQNQLWSFSLASQIKEIYSQPNYPKFLPNTVNENYSCVMHAKFELVNKVIREHLLETKYIGWLDIGLFRAVTKEKHIFRLTLPNNFDHSKVGYSEAIAFDKSLTPDEVVRNNLVWVSGAMFLGDPKIMYLYTSDYMKATLKMIDMNIMSTDQQVIYNMYLPSFHFKPRVEIQIFTSHGGDDWFYIGYIIKDMDDIKTRNKLHISYYLCQTM